MFFPHSWQYAQWIRPLRLAQLCCISHLDRSSCCRTRAAYVSHNFIFQLPNFASSLKLNSSLRSRWSNMQVVSISLPGGRTKTAVHRCSTRKQLTLLGSVCSDNSLKPDVLQLSHTAAQSEPRRFILLFFIFHFHLIQLWKLSLKFS